MSRNKESANTAGPFNRSANYRLKGSGNEHQSWIAIPQKEKSLAGR